MLGDVLLGSVELGGDFGRCGLVLLLCVFLSLVSRFGLLFLRLLCVLLGRFLDRFWLLLAADFGGFLSI